MSMKIKIALWGLAVAALALAASPPARAQVPCRKAVVVYLDVSGSMYENCYRASLPWSGGRSLTLMENTVRFLRKRLLNPVNGGVQPGDRLTVRGFYSQVGTLLGPLDPYDPKRARRGFKDLDRELDVNHNRCYDLGDAKPELQNFRYRNRFLSNQGEPLTDFLPVVKDMVNQYQITLGSDPEGFDQLIFIILTDGDHENDATFAQFQQAVAQAGQIMRDDLRRQRVKVLFFGVSLFGGKKASRRKITAHFQRAFGIVYRELDPRQLDAPAIRSLFRSIQKRIGLVELGQPRYQRGDDQLQVKAIFNNPSCRPLTLTKLRYRICLLPPAGEKQAGAAAKKPARDPCARAGVHEVKMGQTLAPGVSRTLEIVFPRVSRLVEIGDGSRLRLSIRPVTAGVGTGEARTSPVLEIPYDYSGVIILVLLLVGVGLGLFMFIRRQLLD